MCKRPSTLSLSDTEAKPGNKAERSGVKYIPSLLISCHPPQTTGSEQIMKIKVCTTWRKHERRDNKRDETVPLIQA